MEGLSISDASPPSREQSGLTTHLSVAAEPLVTQSAHFAERPLSFAQGRFSWLQWKHGDLPSSVNLAKGDKAHSVSPLLAYGAGPSSERRIETTASFDGSVSPLGKLGDAS